MADDYNVHDIQIQHQVRLAAGKAANVTHLTFYVGSQGPFMHDFPAGQDSEQQIGQYIQQQVAAVRSIVGRAY